VPTKWTYKAISQNKNDALGRTRASRVSGRRPRRAGPRRLTPLPPSGRPATQARGEG
jgi:hypothetical protein